MIPFTGGFSLEALRAAFFAYGVFAPFVLGLAEEILFFIPSALLFTAMGAMLIPSDAAFGPALARAFGQIAFPATFGVLLGAALMYALAYAGGKTVITTFGRYFGVHWADVERTHRFFGKGYADEAVLVALRAIPVFPISVVSVFCGLVRIRPIVFLSTTFIGSFLRIGLLASLGWYAGREYAALAGHIAVFERFAAVALLLALVAFVIYLRSRHRNPVTRRGGG
jgi:membrane protein DedA with SNARE-associated domain